MPRFPRLFVIACLALLPTLARADSATQPSDPPVAAAMAPTYISIGRDLSLRLRLVRQSLDELSINPPLKTQADNLIDSAQHEVDDLISQMQAGRMPSNQRVLAVPANLQQARARLYALIGPDFGRRLDEALQSLRGEARMRLGRVRVALADAFPAASQQAACAAVFKDADRAAQSLPNTKLDGDQYDTQRAAMNHILATTHDRLAAILTPTQQAALGPRFTDLSPE